MVTIADVNPSSPVACAYPCGSLQVTRYTRKKAAVPLAGLTLVHLVSTPSVLATINAHNWAGLLTPSVLSGIPHAFLATSSSPAPRGVIEKFRRMVARGVGRNRPVPVILSLSLSTSYSLSTAKSSMDEWLTLAQASGRNTPFLWVGPTAPGLQKDSRDNIHASSWQYSQDAAQEARNRGLDALGMYNATLQADSWDGKHYGEKVALIQAMMVSNPLLILPLSALNNKLLRLSTGWLRFELMTERHYASRLKVPFASNYGIGFH